MTQHFGPTAARPSIIALTALTLAACGGSGTDTSETSSAAPLPQLSAASAVDFGGDCAELANALAGLADTTITGASTEAAGSLTVGGKAVPEHCLVSGTMFDRVSPVDGQSYAIGFEMRLPKAWNGRFYYQANGGIDGIVRTATGTTGDAQVTGALDQGFAVLSSDAGHSISRGPLFGLDPQARLDYGYQAVGKLTPMAKEAIRLAYGKAPDRSYIGGCSNGGRHTLVAAARYADQYDGYLLGAPGFNLPKAALANIYGAQRYATVATDPADLNSALTGEERTLISNAVLARCDALDGLSDGMVQDTGACQAEFDLERDVPTCSGARDGSCLTSGQKSVVADIFRGATTSDGSPFYAGFPFDSGFGSSNVAFWEFFAPINLDSGAVGFIFKVPPADPATFSGPDFALNADIDTLVAEIGASDATYTESSLDFMRPPNPTELSALKNRGAKMIVYHGVSDAIFSVDDTTAWYEGLAAANGGDASDFARFFRVPGMNHCDSGPATDQFDALSALVNWVEQGVAPERIVATVRGSGNAAVENEDLPADWAADRSRPLCPYPKVARYDGSGDPEVADSFSCR